MSIIICCLFDSVLIIVRGWLEIRNGLCHHFRRWHCLILYHFIKVLDDYLREHFILGDRLDLDLAEWTPFIPTERLVDTLDTYMQLQTFGTKGMPAWRQYCWNSIPVFRIEVFQADRTLFCFFSIDFLCRGLSF